MVIAGAVLRPVGSSSSAVVRAAGQRQFAQLFEHQKAVFLVADDTRRADLDVGTAQAGEPADRLLEQAVIAVQHQKLLRIHRARQAATGGCRCRRR